MSPERDSPKFVQPLKNSSYYQITRNKTRKGKKYGKCICSDCKGNHWKEDCPRRAYPDAEATNLIFEKLESESIIFGI